MNNRECRSYDVSIIIPNYNGAKLLKKNLPQVIKASKQQNIKTSSYQSIKTTKQQNDKIEFIVVDDGSIRDEKLEIRKLKLEYDFKLIEYENNKGFASAVNTGVKNAKGDIVVLLNTDIVPANGFLRPLLKHFDDPKVFAVGCMDKSVEKGKIVKRGRGVAWWERGFLVHRRGEVNKTDTFWVNGGSGAFRKSIWEKLGGMDELYNPFYWEDIDLSYRAVKSGYKLVFEPKSVVVHKHEEGAIKTYYSASKTKTIAYRNQFFFVWKNISSAELLISHILWLPYHKIKAAISGDWPFFKGLILAFLNAPLLWKKRIEIQQLFKYDDQQIICPK